MAVISGRTSEAVAVRCAELGIRAELVVLGSKDKVADLERIEALLDLVDREVAAMGDDLPDLPMLARVGFAACPADAAPEVVAACDLVCGANGGRGAVREVAELILKVQGKWMDVVGAGSAGRDPRVREAVPRASPATSSITASRRSDRTGTGTLSVFGYQMRFDLAGAFPLLTTKRLHLRSIIHELLWFLAGDTNVRYLHEHGVTIWDEWADERRRSRAGLRRAVAVVADRRRRPHRPDREAGRGIRSATPTRGGSSSAAWNVADLDRMALPPCHALFQFYVAEGGLSCQLYQRSADVFLGVPFNIASYALLTMMVAQVCGLEAHEFVHTFGDVHLYLNHVEQAKTQLAREPRRLPTMRLNPEVDRSSTSASKTSGSRATTRTPHIKAPIAV